MVNETNPGKGINDLSAKAPDATSHFDLNRRLLTTLRFGEVAPHLAFNYVPDDKKVTVHSANNVKTFTLGSPLMADIKMRKAYFSVPMQCYLPNNWEKIYRNPDNGDDVVAENVNSVLDMSSLVGNVFNFITNKNFDTVGDYFVVIRAFLLLESVLSSGSVIRNLGYSYNCFNSRQFSIYKGFEVKNVFDNVFEDVLDGFRSFLVSNQDDSEPFQFQFLDPIDGNSLYLLTLGLDLDKSVGTFVTFDDLLFRMREHNCWRLSSGPFDESSPVVDITGGSSAFDFISDAISLLDSYRIVNVFTEPFYYNFDRLIAYNIVCKHYLTNDKVDNIYSAELYRQYMKSLIFASNGDSIRTFSYNGVTTEYDVFSDGYMSDLVDGLNFYIDDPDIFRVSLFALTEFFGYKRSLRFVDYFTGSRPQCLAVGDTNVGVNENFVNVVDVIQKIQRTRFYNAVARVGKRIEQYIEGVFHTKMAYDYHNPAWLATVVDDVYTQEVENTGEAQLSAPNSITSVLTTNNSDRYAFEMDFDRPGVVIGVTLFDIQRAYAFSNDRQNLEVNRFDMFNPFLQFVGDQAVYVNELNGTPNKSPFSYQLRNMDYKQSFDIAAGGFVDNLPGWAFLAPVEMVYNIDDEFIRSRQAELDHYYVSLTGHTLSSRFHFIVVHSNQIAANRPMVYQPQLL